MLKMLSLKVKYMEKVELSEETRNFLEENKPLIVGDWSASCHGKTFQVNNNGIKMAARDDEGLEKIIFNTEKKTVSVKVRKPTLPTKVPRTVDLSNATEFFEELRKDIENAFNNKRHICLSYAKC